MTVHDATPWKFAQTMSAAGRLYFHWTLARAIRMSRLIITPSQASKEEVVDQFGVPGERVRVVHHGVRSGLWAAAAGGGARTSAPDHGYVLFVGTVEPRKNLPVLIRAVAKLRGQDPVCQLVIAGRLAWGTTEVEKALKEERAAGAVALRGHVPDAELISLYRRAACLVQPSVHEGFGYPLVEAMTLGCPVVASNIAPHVEVLGDAGLYFSPHDVDGLVTTLRRVLTDERLRNSLITKARARSESFAPRRFGERTLEAYREAMRS